MKKILFDGSAMQGWSGTQFHGGADYAKYILRKAIDYGYSFDVVFYSFRYNDPDIDALLKNRDKYKIFYVTNKKELYELISNGNYDVFYSALPYEYTDYKCKAKLIGVIHGLRDCELPWDIYRYKYYEKTSERLVRYLVSNCRIAQNYLKSKHIAQKRKLLEISNASFIAVSNHSKYALLSFFPFLKNSDIAVYYSPFSVEQDSNDYDKDNYYLMVSGDRFEKNIYRAVLAFDNLFSKGFLCDKVVTITGCSKYPFWKEIKNKKRFNLLPYVSNNEMETLYKKAFCFVYPSLNEGFGYPPCKAMAYGTPVIASSAASIPEVCGDAACYFSPISIDDLQNRILQIDNDETLRERLIVNGRHRVDGLLQKQYSDIGQILEQIFT